MLLLSLLSLFQSRTPTQGVGAAHIQDGLSCLEIPSQTCPEVCLLGDFNSCHIDINVNPHNGDASFQGYTDL